MRKKQYIRPNLFAKEARIFSILDGSIEGEGDDMEAVDPCDANSRNGFSFQDDMNSDCNTEWSSIWD